MNKKKRFWNIWSPQPFESFNRLLLPLVTQEPDGRLGNEGQAHRLDDVEEGGYDGHISPIQQGAETVAEQTANANDEAKKCQEDPSPFQRAWILTVLACSWQSSWSDQYCDISRATLETPPEPAIPLRILPRMRTDQWEESIRSVDQSEAYVYLRGGGPKPSWPSWAPPAHRPAAASSGGRPYLGKESV